jgi:hypothetical protein
MNGGGAWKSLFCCPLAGKPEHLLEGLCRKPFRNLRDL